MDAMPGDRDRCIDAAVNDCSSKPVKRKALAKVLKRWCTQTPVLAGRTPDAARK